MNSLANTTESTPLQPCACGGKAHLFTADCGSYVICQNSACGRPGSGVFAGRADAAREWNRQNPQAEASN